MLWIQFSYLNSSKSSAALREYRRVKGLRRGPMSTNGLRKMMKFENTGDFGVAPGRGRRHIPMEVDQVSVTVADRTESAINSATSTRAVSRELGVPWSTEKFCAAVSTGTPSRLRLCSNWNPHDPQVLIFPFSFWHEWKWMTRVQRIYLWTDKTHFTL